MYRSFSFFLVSLLVFPLIFTACTAQKPADYGIKSKKALNYFLSAKDLEARRDYRSALRMYETALQYEPDFGEANFRAGGAHYALKDYDKALDRLTKAEKVLSNPNPMLYFYLGEVNLKKNNYEAAAEYYEEFLSSKRPVAAAIVNTAKKNLKSAQFAMENAGDRIDFELENLGENINSQFDEYLPCLTADEQTIFFTSRRPGNEGGFQAEIRDYAEDFYYAEKKDGKWAAAVNFGPPINTEFNEGAASFSPDGQYVYFASCNRPDSKGSCDIYVSRLNGNTWSKPVNMEVANSESWDSQPCISHDGKTLYFSSSRPGGKGGADIWYSEFKDGRWQLPVPLEGPVNTPGTENSPFIHADGKTLYFSSDKHPGFGQLDLFLSRKKDGKWSAPENLGAPLNTTAVEGNIYVNPRGDKGYINSYREGGQGRSDIYYFELDPKIRPEFATFVRGYVLDDVSGKPVRAKVSFINLRTGETVREVFSNKATGKFLLTLPIDEDYAAYVEGKGYLFKSLNFSLKNLPPAEKERFYDLEIRLQKIEVGAIIVLNNIFYETAKFDLKDESTVELEKLLRLLKKNPGLKIEVSGHTDNVGSNEDNKVLSQNRAGEVKKYLLAKGIAKDRISAKGYGETQPIASNDDEAGRAQNRRTEFKVLAN